MVQYLPALLYMGVAGGLLLFNKAALSSFDFPAPTFVVLCQQVFCFLLCSFLSGGGYLSIKRPTVANLRTTAPLAISFVAYLVTGMIALQKVNVPMYTSLRRTTVMFVLVLDFILEKKHESKTVVLAVALQVLGGFIAGFNDLVGGSAEGIFWIFVYNSCTALYLIFISRLRRSTEFSSFDLLYFNSVICSPCLVLILFLTPELSALEQFDHWSEPMFFFSFFSSVVLAFFLNITIFWNTSANSPLTQQVCGQLKDVFSVLISLMIFNDYSHSILNNTGVVVGFLGSFYYAYLKVAGNKDAVVETETKNKLSNP